MLLGASTIQVYASGASEEVEAGHPNLTVTQKEMVRISSQVKGIPRAEEALEKLTSRVDAVLARPMDVPVPKDAGGGYTHEQHKRNFNALYDAALVFQITKKTVYLEFIRSMLLQYAELYPTLDIHPKHKEQTPGKLFWQSLNEAMWLVHTIQAYDMVFASLPKEDRAAIENKLLRPMAHYLSAGQPQTFNKIHNHGTWAAAAVGMTGYVLNDKTLVRQALYGLDMSGKAGFLKQIEQLFSPDGYYAEGPYYQRFALLPFVLFSKAIQVNQPELEIFKFRDEILLKAIRTAIQLNYNKLFFGINDAIKDKGIDTIELVHAIAIAYEITNDASLLSVAEEQNHTLLTGYGFAVAKALQQNLAQPFQYKSMLLRDGKDGDQGALAIFRNGIEKGHQALVMKNTSQGLGHGHFDKLHFLYFDNGNEIVSDYGAARFLNVEAKYGGHYLAENNAWAKQTIAHNTVVVDERSQFDGDWRVAQKSAPETEFFEVADNVKISAASIDSAYEGVQLFRTMAMLKLEGLEHPLIVDIFELISDARHQYDLPLHYQGQIISHNMALRPNAKRLSALGEDNGYQYLWDRGRAPLENGLAQLTWLNDGRFYTYSAQSEAGQEMVFAQLGANDPNFNLRNESALIHRVSKARDHTFVSVLETHGEYNGRAEFTRNAQSSVAALSATTHRTANIVTISLVDGTSVTLAVAKSGDHDSSHNVVHNGQTIEWVGRYTLLQDRQTDSEKML